MMPGPHRTALLAGLALVTVSAEPAEATSAPTEASTTQQPPGGEREAFAPAAPATERGAPGGDRSLDAEPGTFVAPDALVARPHGPLAGDDRRAQAVGATPPIRGPPSR